MMNSLRRWLYRPKQSDPALLAQFYFADEELNLVATELDSFEGRKDPERCTTLINQLRACQARVLNVVSQIMDECIKDERTLRDFRVKFPDDVIQENLAGQLWFGAECLAAGSSIMNREIESACMRPLARALTKNLDSLRTLLREQCLHSVREYSEQIKESLIIFDKLFAEFELNYVSALVPVKSAHEYDMVQEITVLFSETVQRALSLGLLTNDMIDEYDPALMFTIPRLAIVSGILVFKDGPLNPDNDPWNIPEMFRPFQTLLLKIRELLSTLTNEELNTLERALCSQEEPSFLASIEEEKRKLRDARRGKDDRKKKKKRKGSEDEKSVDSELTAHEIAERLEALALSFEMSRTDCQALPQDGATNTVAEHANGVADNADAAAAATVALASSSSSQYGDTSSEGSGNVMLSNNSSQAQETLPTNTYYSGNSDRLDFKNHMFVPVPSSALSEDRNSDQPTALASNRTNSSLPTQEHAMASMKSDLVKVDEEEMGENLDELEGCGRPVCVLNKCDSNDSGLHSEVVSNSGSMFTISSNDSNQQNGISDHIPFTADQAELDEKPIDNQSAMDSNLGSSSVCDGNSKAASVPVPTACSNDDVLKCTRAKSFLSKQDSTVLSQEEIDDIMVSPLEEKMKEERFRECEQPDIEKGVVGSDQLKCSCNYSTSADTLSKQDYVPCSCCAVKRECSFDTSSQKEDISQDTVSVKLHNIEACENPTGASSAPAKCSVDQTKQSSGEVTEHLIGTSSSPVIAFCRELAHSIVTRAMEAHDELEHFSATPYQASCACDAAKSTAFNKKISIHSSQGGKVFESCEQCVENLIKVSSNSIPSIGPCSGFNSSSAQETDTCDVKPVTNGDGQKSADALHHEEKCRRPSSLSTTASLCSVEPTEGENCPESASLSTTSSASARIRGNSTGLHSCGTESENMAASTSAVELEASAEQGEACGAAKARSADETYAKTPKACQHAQASGKSSGGDAGSKSASTKSSSHTTKKHKHSSSKAKSGAAKDSKSQKTTSRKSRRQTETRATSSKDKRQEAAANSAKMMLDSHLLDSDCCNSGETSSYTSDCGDQEEIALAIEAAESATRNQVRARFKNSSDMIHRLFVCISGVADQLQTNFAGDLRNILRSVFDMNCSEPIDMSENDQPKDTTPLGAAYRAISHASQIQRRHRHSSMRNQEPPVWIPDELCNECMACQVPFTFVRRRHHCRNCGKIFCSRCSANSVPLPHFGQEKSVRVCNRCFMFRVTPFTVRSAS